MKNTLYWLTFKAGDDYMLSPYLAESRQEALHHGMQHVLDRELVAVFSNDTTLEFDEMLRLAPLLPRPGSPMWRAPGGE